MFESVEAFYRPANVREALQLLQRGKGSARIVAGCTDVIVGGDRSVRFLIDITHAGLSYNRRRGANWAIGATTTMAEIEDSAEIRGLAGGLLSRAAATCGPVQIRNMATVGGNMANGSPAADLATPLLALDAAAVVADARGRRKMPLADYLAAARSPLRVVVPEVRAHCGRYLGGQRSRRVATGRPRAGEVGAHRAGGRSARAASYGGRRSVDGRTDVRLRAGRGG